MTIASAATAPTSYCDGAYTPSLTITNTSATGIDSALVSYSLNGSTPVTQLITTTIAVNGSTTVNFPQITLTGTSNVITYSYDFATYNATLLDVTLITL